MQATYLAWLDVSDLGLDKPATFFETAGVGLSDGTHFGAQRHLRLRHLMPAGTLSDGARKDGTRAAPKELIPTDGRRSYR